MIARLLLMTASFAGAALLGRRVINMQIEQKVPTEIETARTAAIAELEKQIGEVVSERLSSFVFSLFIKAGLIGGVYLLFVDGHLTATGLKILVGFLIAVFIFRDASRTIPYMAPAFRLIQKHRWNPKKTVIEFVAGVAFERAYAEAMVAMETGPNRLWLALSKYSAHSLSSDVAAAVADVARTTTYQQAKGRVLIAGLLAAFMFSLYLAFFFITVGQA